MRWVNFKNSLKQRLNEMLGVDNVNTVDEDKEPNYWSLQAAMLVNLRRIVKALVGNAVWGRPMEGCDMSRSGSSLRISSGLAVTPGGNIVVFNGATKSVGSYPDAWHNVFLEYKNTKIPETGGPADVGKSTYFIGQSGSEDIVYDDYGALDDGAATNVIITTSTVLNADYAYLGKVNIASGVISTDDDVENSPERGLSPNLINGDDPFFVKNIKVSGTNESVAYGEAEFYNVVINGATEINGTLALNDDVTIDDSKTITLPADAGKIKVGGADIGYSGTVNPSSLSSMEIKNGIIVGTPS